MVGADFLNCPVMVSDDGPFIPLPTHVNFRLTPRRESDVDDLLVLYNTPEIGRWFWQRPYPYRRSDAQSFVDRVPAFNAQLAVVINSLPNPPTFPQPHSERLFPFSVLREVTSDKLVGMMFLGPGEDEGTWEMAYDLHPAFWGRGVGSGMIQATLAYARWLGARRVVAFHEPENTPSHAVLRKAGFTRAGDKEMDWPEEKGGGKKLVYGWEYWC
ncbi:hypothetical protein L204_101288 [Cryptococcus depauperatus]|nr:hypothetical protein L204_03958 [Cryptococcus depauperatus CBS 7855]